MGRLRVTSAMRKQLSDIREVRSNSRRGGVMKVPPILSIDEWEALAASSQDALIIHTRDMFQPVEVASVKPSVDPDIEHERLYQEHRRHTRESALEYVRHKEEHVRRITTVRR